MVITDELTIEFSLDETQFKQNSEAIVKKMAMALVKYLGEDEGSADNPYFLEMAQSAFLAALPDLLRVKP